MFDEIVVGAGSAGAVIASRLSEDPQHRVLLVEAGPDYPSKAVTPPSILSSLTPARDHDWGFFAEMVPGRSTDYPRGKVVGGSSAVNNCFAVRGIPSDYKEWVALGNTDWSWEHVQPVFRAIERDIDFANEHHGNDGPIEVRRYPRDRLIRGQLAFYEACKELGFQETGDHNSPESTGIGTGPWNIDAYGTRISTAIAYLQLARKRPNFVILADRLVERVHIENGRAVGIDIVGDNGREQVRGRRVTISCGAVGTPAILMRSGIGDPGDLAAKGVVPIVSRPGVGRNLVDHAAVAICWQAPPGIVEEETPYIQTVCRYTASDSHRFNDMQILLFQPGQPSFRLSAALLKPLSVGQLALASPDPTVQPDVRLNLLSEPEDMRRMIEGIRLIGKFIALPRMKQFGSNQLILSDGVEMPATEFNRRIDDDAWIADYANRVVRHYVHPVGTARMGPATDPDAVVDQHGRVHGIAGLRVADASIMPTIPSANTNFPCIMIGERIAKWMQNESD